MKQTPYTQKSKDKDYTQILRKHASKQEESRAKYLVLKLKQKT